MVIWLIKNSWTFCPQKFCQNNNFPAFHSSGVCLIFESLLFLFIFFIFKNACRQKRWNVFDSTDLCLSHMSCHVILKSWQSVLPLSIYCYRDYLNPCFFSSWLSAQPSSSSAQITSLSSLKRNIIHCLHAMNASSLNIFVSHFLQNTTTYYPTFDGKLWDTFLKTLIVTTNCLHKHMVQRGKRTQHKAR